MGAEIYWGFWKVSFVILFGNEIFLYLQHAQAKSRWFYTKKLSSEQEIILLLPCFYMKCSMDGQKQRETGDQNTKSTKALQGEKIAFIFLIEVWNLFLVFLALMFIFIAMYFLQLLSHGKLKNDSMFFLKKTTLITLTTNP